MLKDTILLPEECTLVIENSRFANPFGALESFTATVLVPAVTVCSTDPRHIPIGVVIVASTVIFLLIPTFSVTDVVPCAS